MTDLNQVRWRAGVNTSTFQPVWWLFLAGRPKVIETKIGMSDVEYELNDFRGTLTWLISELERCNASPEESTAATIEYILLLYKLKEKYGSA